MGLLKVHFIENAKVISQWNGEWDKISNIEWRCKGTVIPDKWKYPTEHFTFIMQSLNLGDIEYRIKPEPVETWVDITEDTVLKVGDIFTSSNQHCWTI